MDLPGGSDSKESSCNAGDLGSIPGLRRFPGGRHCNPFQYSCLENPHGQRSLAGYSPWSHKESDVTERLSPHTHTHTHTHTLNVYNTFHSLQHFLYPPSLWILIWFPELPCTGLSFPSLWTKLRHRERGSVTCLRSQGKLGCKKARGQSQMSLKPSQGWCV